MPKGIFFVQSQASDESRTDEFHKWYDNTHIPQLCEIPGIVSARRFDLVSAGFAPADPSVPKHLAIYELDADDLGAVMQEIMARSGDGRMELSDALQHDPAPATLLYVERD
ncbi:MAG: hypothetical protein WD271_05390 [Acidimicrobiia bacterium]